MNSTKTRSYSNSKFMELWGTDTYEGLVSVFEKRFDRRTPAKAVMAIYGTLQVADRLSDEKHTEDEQMEAARMIVVQMAGFIVDKVGGGLPDAVQFIAQKPIEVFTKFLELGLND